MRELVESRVRNSRWFQNCVDNGIDVPVLHNMSDSDLLELFAYTETH